MATERDQQLVQTSVEVTDARGRTRMEARWVLADEHAHKHPVAA